MRQSIKILLTLIGTGGSGYFMYITNSALGTETQFGESDDALKVIYFDIMYVFLFNIIIQGYILPYYLVIGNAKIAFFESMAKGLVSNVVSGTIGGVKNLTVGTVGAAL